MYKKRCRQIWHCVPLLVLLLCAAVAQGHQVELLSGVKTIE